eukprot:TRINITY_DN75874_c0_g1_i1.p1 TRINITY_DN75874_c0_g1~~TRINITY_DN75874_c0_g1_i1.p1  ORF type:complete len:169 (-),score=39.13 TRINITY_DN75874_c0_g1_i1:92-562(-)
MAVLCDVCETVEKKYKCPVCQIFYCSLSCFKTHKDTGCNPPQNIQEPEIKDEEMCDEAFLFQTPDTVPIESLQLLAKSDKLKALLTNPHLREFLTILDSSEEKGRLMRKAMKEPLFIEFVDSCLEVIDPDSVQKELTDAEVLQAVKDSVDAAEDDL